MQEQALRSNTAVDQEFTKFVEPKDANIKISITTDTRISGTHRLAFLIGELLKREGYTNVAPFHHNEPMGEPNEELRLGQKDVRITIEDPLNKALKDFDLERGGCGYDVGHHPVVIENKNLKSA